MPSRISQMRNGQIPFQQPQQMQTQQYNYDYINQLKTIMRSKNSMQLLNNLAAVNPKVKQLLDLYASGGNLQPLAQQLAQQRNIDLNSLINQLLG